MTNSAASQRRRATVGRLAKYFAARAIPGRPVFVADAAASRLRFYSHRQDVVGRHIAKYGAHEPVLTEWLGHHLDAGPPGIFVDVGAHIGWHALNAAMHESVTKVVAFEPDPFNGSLLRRNIALNHVDKIEVCPCAVGRAPGLARLHQYRATNFGAHSLAVDHGLGSTVVPVIDLDTALADLGFAEAPILAIKMDVEGYEPAVVAGAARSLARAACVVAEFSPELSAAAGLSVSGMFDALAGQGFSPSMLEHAGEIRETGFDALQSFEGQCDLILERR